MSMNLFLKSLMVALLVTLSAQAAVTRTWVGSVSSDWFTAENWDPVGVPEPNATAANGDTAVIPAVAEGNFAPVVVGSVGDGTEFIASININGGDLTISAASAVYAGGWQMNTTNDIAPNLTCYGLLNITGGSKYIQSGTVTFDGPGALGYIYRRQEYGSLSGSTMTINCINGGSLEQYGSSYEYFITAAGGTGNTCATYLNILGSGSSVINTPHTSVNRLLFNRRNSLGHADLAGGGLFRMNATQPTIQGWINTNQVRTSDMREVVTIAPYGAYLFDVTAVRQYKAYAPTPPNNGPVGVGEIPLSWKQPYSENNTDTVLADVYCGTYDVNEAGIPTDPNGYLLPKIAEDVNSKTVTFTTAPAAKYQWRVDLYDPNTDVTTRGDIWYFEVANQAPAVNAGADQFIGLRGGTVNFVSNASVTDDGLPLDATVTYLWTQLDGPVTLVIDPDNTMNVSVPITVTGTYVFQLTANDTALTGTDQVTVNVYADACTAAKAVEGYTADAGDVNDDCAVDFKDFAVLAGAWRNCTSMDPLDPVCQ